MAELKEEVRDLIAEIIEKDPSDVGDDVPLKNLNVDSMQAYCDAHGLALRAHAKTHKLPQIARLQLDAGAVGIACQ